MASNWWLNMPVHAGWRFSRRCFALGATALVLIRARLFEPLSMQATFGWPAFDDPQQPWGHYETKNGVRPHDPHDKYQAARKVEFHQLEGRGRA